MKNEFNESAMGHERIFRHGQLSWVVEIALDTPLRMYCISRFTSRIVFLHNIDLNTFSTH